MYVIVSPHQENVQSYNFETTVQYAYGPNKPSHKRQGKSSESGKRVLYRKRAGLPLEAYLSRTPSPFQ